MVQWLGLHAFTAKHVASEGRSHKLSAAAKINKIKTSLLKKKKLKGKKYAFLDAKSEVESLESGLEICTFNTRRVKPLTKHVRVVTV